MRKRRKTPSARRKVILDAQWSKLTKRVWGQKCRWCGKTGEVQSDHIFNRWKHTTRWIIENCVVLCVGCHLFRKKREPAEWYEMVRQEIGDELLEALRKESERIEKPDLDRVEQYLDSIEQSVEREEWPLIDNGFMVKRKVNPEASDILESL